MRSEVVKGLDFDIIMSELRQEGVGLITSDEVESSMYSSSDAANFFVRHVDLETKAATTAVQEPSAVSDDMFADME
jgi:hypothetical protein